MKIAAVLSTKGGPGKTTVTASLGAFCADSGLRTLLIDLDNQPSLSSFYALTHEAPGGAYELIANNETRRDQIISQTCIPNLSLIHSNDPFNQLGTLLLHAADGRLRLKNLISTFEPDFDLVLVDTQGARSIILEMALLGADMVIPPIERAVDRPKALRSDILALVHDIADELAMPQYHFIQSHWGIGFVVVRPSDWDSDIFATPPTQITQQAFTVLNLLDGIRSRTSFFV